MLMLTVVYCCCCCCWCCGNDRCSQIASNRPGVVNRKPVSIGRNSREKKELKIDDSRTMRPREERNVTKNSYNFAVKLITKIIHDFSAHFLWILTNGNLIFNKSTASIIVNILVFFRLVGGMKLFFFFVGAREIFIGFYIVFFSAHFFISVFFRFSTNLLSAQ